MKKCIHTSDTDVHLYVVCIVNEIPKEKDMCSENARGKTKNKFSYILVVWEESAASSVNIYNIFFRLIRENRICRNMDLNLIRKFIKSGI